MRPYPHWYPYTDGKFHKTKIQDDGSVRFRGNPRLEESICGIVHVLVTNAADDLPQEMCCENCWNVLLMLELSQ